MGEDISRDIQARMRSNMDAASQAEQTRRYEEQAARTQASFVGFLAAREGIAIRELGVHGFANEEARKLLAGFVASASARRVPVVTENHAEIYYGKALIRPFVNASRRNMVSGWRVSINNYEYWPAMADSRETGFTRVLASPDYRLYGRFYKYRGGLVDEGVVRASVIESLAASGANWAEPEPSTYL